MLIGTQEPWEPRWAQNHKHRQTRPCGPLAVARSAESGSLEEMKNTGRELAQHCPQQISLPPSPPAAPSPFVLYSSPFEGMSRPGFAGSLSRGAGAAVGSQARVSQEGPSLLLGFLFSCCLCYLQSHHSFPFAVAF